MKRPLYMADPLSHNGGLVERAFGRVSSLLFAGIQFQKLAEMRRRGRGGARRFISGFGGRRNDRFLEDDCGKLPFVQATGQWGCELPKRVGQRPVRFRAAIRRQQPSIKVACDGRYAPHIGFSLSSGAATADVRPRIAHLVDEPHCGGQVVRARALRRNAEPLGQGRSQLKRVGLLSS